MFGDPFPTRTSLWSHLHQRASGESPAGGQASDPDTEGEAQHSQSLNLLISSLYTMRISLWLY